MFFLSLSPILSGPLSRSPSLAVHVVFPGVQRPPGSAESAILRCPGVTGVPDISLPPGLSPIILSLHPH
ncbi:hypothetical protein GBAR_LOCUS13350 [Geodia barretti]|uniref:Uncharacterized protein n=1 Tax=Geodia barretti TaxID=519541 RepID=A0AA35S3J8_GEOBA|nr:hypothetical protein GBAR_LOCUS13350 [Geodia barretti]